MVTEVKAARKITNPASGAVLDEITDSTSDEVEAALVRATRGQQDWERVPRHERARILADAAALFMLHRPELARLLTAENGKPLEQALAEIALTARLYRGFADRVLALEETARYLDTQPGLEHDLQITRSEPLGVVAAIIPFNFPSEICAHKVAPALATGNAVVIKPSEETPLTLRREVELLHEAGVPQDAVQIVFGGAEVGQMLSDSPAVAAIAFTGSTEGGISVATSGARTLKRVFLELGGNDAMVVYPDADLAAVVAAASSGRALANGQCCCANKRLVAHRSIAGELTDRLVETFGGLRVGDPSESDTQLGPLIHAVAARRVHEQVQRTVSQGAKVAIGGTLAGECFYAPTVLTDVRPEMDIAADMEVFGPVLAVLPFGSQDEAIAIANATRYGLSGSVFTSDITTALSTAGRMKTGQVVINGTGLYRPDAMGFGGYKHSGNVREGLSTSLREYVQLKTISLPGVVQA